MPERKTVLHGLHAELGARFVPFAGFEMPVQYRDGLRAEHLHTRSQAGLFDVSHMGQARVTGPGLHRALERALPIDFDDWPVGAQRYSLLLNERGGIEDDLMVTRLADEVRIVGYTGEDGFEISVPLQDAAPLARELLKNPAVKPIGLGARDTLRLEAGLHLYGEDMDADTTPFEASLGWAIARSRRPGGAKAGGFPGAEAYQRQSRRLVGLLGEEPVPVRHGAKLVDSENGDIGIVTSGTVSPSTQRAIMLGYVGAGFTGKDLLAVVRGAQRPVRITQPPFVPKRYKK